LEIYAATTGDAEAVRAQSDAIMKLFGDRR
jgi:hypothetical protein